MSAFLEGLGEIGESILDTVATGAGSVGTNLGAQATANQAQAEALLAKARIAEQVAKREQDRKDKQAEVFQTVLYSVTALGAVAVLFLIIQQYRKTM